MARTRLTNQQTFVELQHNPYQVGFLLARRIRGCPNECVFEHKDGCADDDVGRKFAWSMLDSLICPKCGGKGVRLYRRFFLRAGRRGGKTIIGALSAWEEACVPNSIGWCCAPTYAELEDYVLPAFFAIMPKEIFEHPLTEWSEDRLSLVLPNGAQVHFRSLDDPNKATGPGLDWIWIDEGRKIQELAWQIARATLVDKKGIAFITSSPDWGEDWCHRNFWLPAEAGIPGYWAVSYKTIDNPIIDPKEVEEQRISMPPELFRREFEASIEFPTGTIYGDAMQGVDWTDEQVRQWIPEWPKIDPTRPTIAGLDPGTDHPFAGALIVVTPNGLVMVGEYLERNRLIVQHVNGMNGQPGIKHVMTHGGTVTPRWGIDKSQAQIALELSQYGIFAQGANNAVDAGIQRVYAWLATGRFKIAASRCPRGLKQMRTYRWAEVKLNAKGLPSDAVPYKVDDDIADAIRYGVMLWPELPAPPIDVLAAGARNLALLSAKARGEIERNTVKDEEKDGLVRVTDNFDVQYDDSVPAGEGMGDFYR